VMAVAFSLLLSGCGFSRPSGSARDVEFYEDYAYYAEDAMEMDMEMAYAADEASVPYSKSVPASANDAPEGQKRMVQKSASINIQVMDPLGAADKLIELTEQMGGFVVSFTSSQEYYSSDIYLPRANLTIRVPADQLNDTLDFIENLTGDSSKYVSNKKVYGRDITSDYVDMQSRLTSKEKTLDKLYEILDTAENAEEALEVYSNIADVESDIEVYKGQIKYMEESVSLSSIDVQISSIRPAPIKTVQKWNLGDVFKDAFEVLLDSGKSVIEFLVYFVVVVIPILILIAIPVAVVVIVVKKSLKNKKSKNAPVEDVIEPVKNNNGQDNTK
ncbi:MAG: DUF4349 domain-containing protein, partial [Anaerolineaceae bacterium]|nr:DUF4349 domain-containing protein [Anaerolineaceae bacterium]